MPLAALLWFRRDLRLGDHPALLAAAERASRVLALFVLDPALLRPAGAPRIAFLFRCLRALREQLGGRLLVVRGNPERVVPAVAAELGAASVHVTADHGPYGRARDDRVARELDRRGVALVRSGSPYAVPPGSVVAQDGRPHRLFTPFYRSWLRHGWPEPYESGPSTVDWLDHGDARDWPGGTRLPDDPDLAGVELPEAGETAALAAWAAFRDHRLAQYHDRRERPDLPGTSRLSAYLRFGCLHPRTVLADLGGWWERSPSARAFRAELAWREFYADVLWHRPDTARHNADARFDRMTYASGDEATERFAAWCDGRTGYPFVDAGMRQLLAEGWMHNRARMVVASFLTKDLHLPWWWGARHFMRHLVDADLAANQHAWQWVAGSGVDAAPYFRVFNPIRQGERFDPNGDYVRRYVPELRAIPGARVHRPWLFPGGPPGGYPMPIVDHPHERREALRRYSAVKR
ncbi:cryptochrome/photolyase family protein [Gandjariella thermophila]|uniref:Deoxyribodipyrimidine photo-lyase n=1 Tax=Gandjariella thermophila TaxID=1931992 RepID=A0A4D4J3V1_9PSEU|nr:deoxyribodipyrimidine photo-lyase [Gandjariella thermophila]GDY30144.1 deoxyribodipyrimidine photo-lyase [Gandjariella thermophila]